MSNLRYPVYCDLQNCSNDQFHKQLVFLPQNVKCFPLEIDIDITKLEQHFTRYYLYFIDLVTCT